MTRIAYYPGCSLLGSAREYDESLRAVTRALEIELVDVPDWNCCGASAAHSTNKGLGLRLPARILSLAEQTGAGELLVPCAACFSRLAAADRELRQSARLREQMAGEGLPYGGTIAVKSILDFLSARRELIREKAKNAFDYKSACYYGCLLVRPPKVSGVERFEDPMIMEEVLEDCGATAVDWSFKTDCCGAGFSVSRTGVVAGLSGKIIDDAVRRGSEAIVVGCPMCHSNLDMRRREINRAMKKKYSIPVVYITQALGMAMGISSRDLGLRRHMVPVKLSAKVRPAAAADIPAPAAAEE